MASKSSHSDPQVYTDPQLRDRLKAEIQAGDRGGRPGQWSARKSQLLTQEYEKAGGSYCQSERTEAQQHLEHWTKQEWTTADGKPAECHGETARYLPKQAWEKLSPAERRATDRKKREGSRRGEAHTANTEKAKQARKQAQ